MKSKSDAELYSVPTSIMNEDFKFPTDNEKSNINDLPKEDVNRKLQSPVENHYAITPTSSTTSSPKNGITTVEGSNLLQEELNQLAIAEINQENELTSSVKNSISADGLQSPTDENISMFVRVKNGLVESENKSDLFLKPEKDQKQENTPEVMKWFLIFSWFSSIMLQVWTLLDCQFGVPLFDVNANTKICDTLISGGLCEFSR